jgi:hypothetical protein
LPTHEEWHRQIPYEGAYWLFLRSETSSIQHHQASRRGS